MWGHHIYVRNDAHFDNLHECCDICHQKCQCDDCIWDMNLKLHESSTKKPQHTPNDMANEELIMVLFEYLNQENLAGAYVEDTWSLARRIAHQYPLYTDVAKVAEVFHLDDHIVGNIATIIGEFM